MACSRRPGVWTVFVLGGVASLASAGGRVPPIPTSPDETSWSFHLPIDLGAGAEPLDSAYQSVWLKSRTKLMAAVAADPSLPDRLRPWIRRATRHAPADEPALVRTLREAGLDVLARGDLGVGETRRSAWAEFPDEALDDRRLVRVILDAWRDVLGVRR